MNLLWALICLLDCLRLLWLVRVITLVLVLRHSNYKHRALFNWVPKVIPQLLWFCIAALCDWLKNLAPLPRPIRSKTKTNRALLARVFPALGTGDMNLLWALICLLDCLRLLWLVRVITLVLVLRHSNYKHRALFNWVPKTKTKVIPQLLWFCIAALCDWLKNLAPLPRPIRSKTKTNRALLARVFPRLARATWICFELWFVYWIVYDCYDWSE